MASKGISGVGVGLAAAGGVLMYAGIRDVPVLDVLRDITSGVLPVGNKEKDGTPGAATTTALAVLAQGSAGGGVADATQAGLVSGGAFPELAQAALRYKGVPYRWGGKDPATGFDCSGLVYRAFADLGIKAPGTTYSQQPWNKLKTISAAQASAGDLVFWPGHVAVYLGDGMVVHAPKPGTVVRTEQVTQAGPRGTTATYKRYVGAGKPKSEKPKGRTAEV